jgi:hypothetical protein
MREISVKSAGSSNNFGFVVSPLRFGRNQAKPRAAGHRAWVLERVAGDLAFLPERRGNAGFIAASACPDCGWLEGYQRPENGSRVLGPARQKIADKAQGVALPTASGPLVLCFAARRAAGESLSSEALRAHSVFGQTSGKIHVRRHKIQILVSEFSDESYNNFSVSKSFMYSS